MSDDRELGRLVALVRQVCSQRFPGFDPGDFLGRVWEKLRGTEYTRRSVRSACIDCYRTERGARRKLRLVFGPAASDGTQPRDLRPDGDCERRRIANATRRHGRGGVSR